MSAYRAILEMAASQSLISRIAAAAAKEGNQQDPVSWAHQNIWKIVVSEGWSEAWDYATASRSPNVNPDTGQRTDVINDGMIEAAVEDLIGPADPPAPGE